MNNRERGFRAWLIRLLSPRPQTPPWSIVEIERAQPLTEADEAAILTLQHHPGFLALVRKLNLMRAALKATLENQKHADIRDVDSIQSGIYWIGYLEHQLAWYTKVSTNKTPRPAIEEVAEFEKVRALIEGVGHTSP